MTYITYFFVVKSSPDFQAIDSAIRGQIRRRLTDYFDPQSESSDEGKIQSRTVVAGARSIAQSDKIPMAEQKGLDQRGSETHECNCRNALLSRADEIAVSSQLISTESSFTLQ
jgi:hypothetical protein